MVQPVSVSIDSSLRRALSCSQLGLRASSVGAAQLIEITSLCILLLIDANS